MANAWCHGAPGILLTRLKLISLPEYEGNPEAHSDIEKASTALFAHSFREGLCPCHGMAGNYRIMREYEKRCGVDAEQKQIMELMQDSIISRVLEWEMILPQERCAPGMMAGRAGIGCVLADIS